MINRPPSPLHPKRAVTNRPYGIYCRICNLSSFSYRAKIRVQFTILFFFVIRTTYFPGNPQIFCKQCSIPIDKPGNAVYNDKNAI